MPASVAKVVNVDTSGQTTQLEVKNSGDKAISAIVLRRVGSIDLDSVLISESIAGKESLLRPGQIRTIAVPQNKTGNAWNELDIAKINNQLEIAAVIYEDGTHIGGPVPNPAYNNVDTVDQIFEQRRGEADEMEKWAKLIAALPKDDHAAIERYLNDVAHADFAATPEELQVHVGATAYNAYDAGKYMVQQGQYDTATRVRERLATGSSTHVVRTTLIDRFLKSAVELRQQATEVKQ